MHSGRFPFEVYMEQIKLSSRLNAIAALVPTGSSVVDVGTDHGYLPIYLTQAGTYGQIAASDINPGPLEHARRSAEAYGVRDRIQFFLCPGLSFPGSAQYQTVIIAGMGGELIASILRNAPWTKTGKALILQPNSKIDTLNTWLIENGYQITDARLVNDSGRLYQVLAASGGDAKSGLTPAQRLVHPLYFRHRDPLLPEYLDSLIYKYTAALDGMRQSQREMPDRQELEALLTDLRKMRKETEAWQP